MRKLNTIEDVTAAADGAGVSVDDHGTLRMTNGRLVTIAGTLRCGVDHRAQARARVLAHYTAMLNEARAAAGAAQS